MPAASLQCPLCAGVLQVETAWAGGQVACPHCRAPLTLPDEPTLIALTAGGTESPPPQAPPVGVVTLRDESAILRDGADEAKVCRLSPEERARRRLRKNIVLFVVCLGILLVVLYIFAR